MSNNNPLISIIIPCYNVSAYVERATNSILSQTYKNLEIWIIDDASTDDTLERVNQIKDDRIRIIAFKENTQKVGAVNEVLQKVTGDYIAFQDADDWSEPTRIEEQLKEFQNNSELGICFTGFQNIIGGKRIVPRRVCITNEELRSYFLNYDHHSNLQPPMCPSMMISSEALKITRGYHPYFKGRVAEDIHWIYRILKKFNGITVNQILYNYSIRPESLTNLQLAGSNAKAAYSWQLLSKIIFEDVQNGIDLLRPENEKSLRAFELQSCEEALIENVQSLYKTKGLYEKSSSYRLGRILLWPFHYLKSLSVPGHK